MSCESLADGSVDDLETPGVDGIGDELHQRLAKEVERQNETGEHPDTAMHEQLAQSVQVSKKRLFFIVYNIILRDCFFFLFHDQETSFVNLK